MTNRLLAIGDIHGYADALAALIKWINPTSEDTLVTLGDYIDRGPDSKGVIDELIDLEGRCHLVALMGNHEEMMLEARKNRSGFASWMTFGGDTALESYGPDRNLNFIPPKHWTFLERLRLYYETDDYFFVHAHYDPDKPLSEHDTRTLLWKALDEVPRRHYTGKTALLGHSPQADNSIFDHGHVKCIDTGCGHGGLLTALEVKSGQIWQVDENGFA